MTDQNSGPPALYLIAGLGNPGRRYQANRHNIGFLALDRLAAMGGLSFSKSKEEALVCQGELAGRKVLLAKPQTYMNLAGRSVASLARYFAIPYEATLIVLDDMDLPLGRLRLKPSGSSGGHRGLQSILERTGTLEIPRLRIGIGRPPGRQAPASFVLENFGPGAQPVLMETLERAEACIRAYLDSGIQAAMTEFNRDAG
ncbi:MAG: aminoacyl-tRNA hydrolase [Anaerolineales bacterium]|nr:aminoacyl-tRNA hydrolase [Anaerolineales bacterium]